MSYMFSDCQKLNGIDFEATTATPVTISAGSTATVTFKLQPVSTVTTGGYTITIKFPNTVTKVITLLNETSEVTFADNDATNPLTADTDDTSKKLITLQNLLSSNGGGAAPGTYSFKFTFYSSDGAQYLLLNDFTVYAQVSRGFSTTSTIDIADLNEVYDITYKAYKSESEKPAGFTTQDITDLLGGSQTYVNKYTRKTSSITLPVLSKDGYYFAGWYNADNDQPMTAASWTNRTGDITLYAKWSSASVSVDVENPASDLEITSTGLDDPDAKEWNFTIKDYDSNKTYKWYLDGTEITGANSQYSVTANDVTFFKEQLAYGTYVLTLACDGFSVSKVFSKEMPLIGSKRTPNAVGDIVFNDGSAIAYSSNLTLTEEQKAAAVAVIFNVGTDCSNDSNKRVLGLGLKNSNGDSTTYAWAKEGSTGYTTIFRNTHIGSVNDAPTDGTAYHQCYYNGYTRYLTDDFDGHDNWSEVCNLDSNAAASAEENYPAFNYINKYAVKAGLTGTYATGWYLPTAVELHCIYQELTLLNTILESLDNADALAKAENNEYWSSSQMGAQNTQVWVVNFNNGGVHTIYKSESKYVCAIREF